MEALRTSQAPPLAGIDSSPMENTAQPPGDVPGGVGTDPSPTGAAPPSTEFITSFLLHVRQQAADRAVDPTPGATAPDGVSQLPPPANSVADDGAVAASPVTATRKRKVRGSCNHVAKDERKRQRRAASLLATQGDTEAGT